MFWIEDTLKLLDGSILGVSVKAMQNQIKQDYSMVKQSFEGFLVEWDEYLRCNVLVMSRAFRLDGKLFMVPWADALNHSSQAGQQSCLHWEQGSNPKTGVILAHKDYCIGEEVFDSYGQQLTQSQLLCQYGFLEDHAPLQVQIQHIVPGQSMSQSAQLVVSKLQDLLGIFHVRFTSKGVDEYSLALLRAAVSTDEQLQNLGWTSSCSPQTIQRLMGDLSCSHIPEIEDKWKAQLRVWVGKQVCILESILSRIDEYRQRSLSVLEVKHLNLARNAISIEREILDDVKVLS